MVGCRVLSVLAGEGVGLAGPVFFSFAGDEVGDGDGDFLAEGEGGGTSGSESRLGERVTSGGPASSERPLSSSAEIMPVTVPTATTTEAATTMT